MDEHDAFGRTPDDDPLAAMGWSEADGVGTSSAATAATATAAAPADRPVTPAQWAASTMPGPGPARAPVKRSHRSPGAALPVGLRLARTLILFGSFALVALLVVVPMVRSVGDAVDEIRSSVPRFDGSSDPGSARSGPPPAGLGRRSMLLRGNLSPALRELRREIGGGGVRLLRVDATSVQVQAVKGGRLVFARKPWDGPAAIISRSGTAPDRGFPWSRVDPSAPRRIVTAVSRRTGRRAASFDYVVLIDTVGLGWAAFFKGGKGFTATPDGRIKRAL